MESRTLQLVLQYDGTLFAGWQRQPEERTVQGVLEESLARICATPIAVLGAGRTDAGVHATGQAAGIRVPEQWTEHSMRRALNAVLPRDVRVASVHAMRPDFHPRFSAVARGYRYLIGTDEGADAPFKRNFEVAWHRRIDRQLLDKAANIILGGHCFRGFAVAGTASESDDHHCNIMEAHWLDREGGLAFFIRANRFLHHMVRFLVGTMLDVAGGRRQIGEMERLLIATDNAGVSPPAPAHGLYLEKVEYPHELYLADP